MAKDATKDTQDDFDAGFTTPPPAGSFKYGKVGDVIKGVYLSKEPFQGDFGPTFIYKIKAIAGRFHNVVKNVVDANPTELTPGLTYSVYDKKTFSDEIAQAKVGQVVIVRYLEDGVTKKTGKSFKMIVCKLGGMDAEYAKENGAAEEPAF